MVTHYEEHFYVVCTRRNVGTCCSFYTSVLQNVPPFFVLFCFYHFFPQLHGNIRYTIIKSQSDSDRSKLQKVGNSFKSKSCLYAKQNVMILGTYKKCTQLCKRTDDGILHFAPGKKKKKKQQQQHYIIMMLFWTRDCITFIPG